MKFQRTLAQSIHGKRRSFYYKTYSTLRQFEIVQVGGQWDIKFFILTKNRDDNFRKKIDNIHKKKFDVWTKQNDTRKINVNPNWIKNLTETVILERVVECVSLGQNHSVNTCLSTEEIATTIKNLEVNLSELEIDNEEKNGIRNKVSKILYSAKKSKSHITLEKREFLSKIKETENFL